MGRGGRVSGGLMTEDVNKERLASGAAAGSFCAGLCCPEEMATGRRGHQIDTCSFSFFEICLWQINMCIIDQIEREELLSRLNLP